MKNIGIIGCGWLGSRIAKILAAKYTIYATTTSVDKIRSLEKEGIIPTLIDFRKDEGSEKIIQWKEISHLDAVIITLPFSEKREDAEQLKIKLNRLHSFTDDFRGQMFFMSSTGVYPDIKKEFFEFDLPSEDVLGENMMKSLFPQINILRLSGLMGDDRLLSRYNVSDLQSPVNHIHYADIAAVIDQMIELKSSGKLYNVTAPHHPTKAEVINRQKNIPYEENNREIGRVISSQKMISELDFVFTYPDPVFFHINDNSRASS